MNKTIEFGIIGGGWRSEFYLRIARALPERFHVDGMLVRDPATPDAPPSRIDRLKLASPAGTRIEKGLDGLFRVAGGGVWLRTAPRAQLTCSSRRPPSSCASWSTRSRA